MDFNLRTGHSQDAENQYQQHYMNEIMVMLGIFTEDAMRLSGLYCLHSGRNSVTKKDIELALKTRAYHGDTFWNRTDIQQKIEEMRQFLNEPTSESEDEYVSEDDYDENEGEMSELSEELPDETIEMNDIEECFITSQCICEVCMTLNGIQDKWNTWNPNERISQSIKNSIDLTFGNQPITTDDF
jgi:hypothetical protein